MIVKEEETKKQLAGAAFGQSFISEAPVVVVVCANIPRTTSRYGERGSNLYVIQDTAATTQNIHLMAYALGYATCWVGAFNDEKVKKVIKAPKEIRPLAIVPIGKPDKKPQAPPRRSLEEITHTNSF